MAASYLEKRSTFSPTRPSSPASSQKSNPEYHLLRRLTVVVGDRDTVQLQIGPKTSLATCATLRTTTMATDDSTNFLRLNSVDRHGRHIDPAALAAAEAVFRRALELGTNLGIDYAVVANMLEEVAAEASLQVTWRVGVCEAAPIRNLAGYVFRAFVRDLNRLKRKEIALLDEDTPRYTLAQRWVDLSRQLERKVLSDECLARFDFEVREMCSRWMAGYSWDEIGKIHGISGHAAELRFWNAVRRMRKQLGKRKKSLLRTTRTDQNEELKPAMRTDAQKKETSA